MGRLHDSPMRVSDGDIQGLVAQGRTIQETIEIARDVAKTLIEPQSSAGGDPASVLPAAGNP